MTWGGTSYTDTQVITGITGTLTFSDATTTSVGLSNLACVFPDGIGAKSGTPKNSFTATADVANTSGTATCSYGSGAGQILCGTASISVATTTTTAPSTTTSTSTSTTTTTTTAPSTTTTTTTPTGISIDVQPVGGLDYCGNGLSVTASGAASLSYSWQYYDNEYGWSGVGTSSATLPASTITGWVGQNITLRVVVSKSGLSSVTSSSVLYQPRADTLTVTQSPSSSVSALTGSTVNLSVSLSSSNSCPNPTVAWTKVQDNDESYNTRTVICSNSSSCSFSSTGLNGYGIRAVVTPGFGSGSTKYWILSVQ